MAYEISRQEVLNNLIRFKESLIQKRGLKAKTDKGLIRTYPVLLNRHTGDMRFTQSIRALESHISKRENKRDSHADWKQVFFHIEQRNHHEPVHFEIRDPQDHFLKPSDIDPLAWKIASETLDILNLKAKETSQVLDGLLPEEAIVNDLSSLYLSSPKERIEDLPGWMGSLGRIDAEKILHSKRVGTYLLREGDELTIASSFHLAEESRLSIRPYLLTVVKEEGKIADILLLQTNKGWILYEDEPNLSDPSYEYYPSALALIKNLKQIASYPLGLAS